MPLRPGPQTKAARLGIALRSERTCFYLLASHFQEESKGRDAMKKIWYWLLAGLMCLLMPGAVMAIHSGASAQTSSGAQRMQERVQREVYHELVMLPQLTIFDNLQYKVDGSKITLMGQVRN